MFISWFNAALIIVFKTGILMHVKPYVMQFYNYLYAVQAVLLCLATMIYIVDIQSATVIDTEVHFNGCQM